MNNFISFINIKFNNYLILIEIILFAKFFSFPIIKFNFNANDFNYLNLL